MAQSQCGCALAKVTKLLAIQLIIVIFLSVAVESLRCRSDDGPSETELKRMARSCMRKFGEMTYNMQSSQQQKPHQQQQQHQQQSAGGYNNQRMNKNGYNAYNDYDDSEDSNEDDNDGNYRYYPRNYQSGNHNGNNRNSGGGGGSGGNGGNGNGNGAGNSEDERSGNQRNRQRSNNHNKSNGNGNGNGNNQWQPQSQRNQGGGNSQNNNNNNSNSERYKNHNNNKNHGNNSNSNSSDTACIVHCFFEELHMLNNNNYPDRHKVLYILTKDMRDRELRNFYTDTIQECFRYLESQRRREKCQFSRDLISCMTEYAKGNCDDWNEFSMMFN